jgi:hypothetical protein
MPGQTIPPIFSLTPYRQPLNRRQSTSAFSSEILSAFGEKTKAVLDLTFGDGHHSRLLLGIDFFTYRRAKDSLASSLHYIMRIFKLFFSVLFFISSHCFEAKAELF